LTIQNTLQKMSKTS